jgi:hypothetical protein
MSNKKTRWIAAGCVLVCVLAGATGTQKAQPLERTTVATPLFTVGPEEVVYFRVSLPGERGGPQARVLLRLLDEDGAVVARDQAIVPSGGSASIRWQGPVLVRAHALFESASPLNGSQSPVGAAEIVLNTTVTRYIPSHNLPIPGGRD